MTAHSRATALGLLLGYAADLCWADPAQRHPVAAFGTAAMRVEKLTYRTTKAAGVLHVGLLVGGVVLASGAALTVARRAGWWAETGVVAAGTWAALGGTTLARTGTRMADVLADGRVEQARELLPSLCGRDPSVLDSDGLARAALESIAENTSDATVGVVFWGAVAGLPGVVGYRAINTLDAMIGYRNERYGRFGWCAARVDDVANLVPARITGVLTAASAPRVGGRAREVWTTWRRDAAKHPSPNAGVAESAAAGALGITLGGRTAYRHGVEIRPTLGTGRTPTPADLRRAVQLSVAVQALAAVTSALFAIAIGEAGLRLRHRFGRSLALAS